MGYIGSNIRSLFNILAEIYVHRRQNKRLNNNLLTFKLIKMANRDYRNMYWLITAKAFVVSNNIEMLKRLADKCLGIVVKRHGPTVEEAEVVYIGENMSLLDMEVHDNLEYTHLGEECAPLEHVRQWYADDGDVPLHSLREDMRVMNGSIRQLK